MTTISNKVSTAKKKKEKRGRRRREIEKQRRRTLFFEIKTKNNFKVIGIIMLSV